MKKVVKAKLVHKKKKPNIAQVGVKAPDVHCFWESSERIVVAPNSKGVPRCLHMSNAIDRGDDRPPFHIGCFWMGLWSECPNYKPCTHIKLAHRKETEVNESD